MQVRIVATHVGRPLWVDAIVAGVWVRAAWAGAPPAAGALADVELDIDAVLGWGDSIAFAGAEGTLRQGPLLRGIVEQRDQKTLTLRMSEGLLQVELSGGAEEVPLGAAVAVVAEHLTLYPTGV